ncbi:hypothetical protein N7492_001461 [Penicillium capsulatum]|uniref:Cyanovirin-N domain-containing protein n=1 Tax=Penicillium capsulatum TaxID=69766 RepID=A0A9W9ISE2_9EURO|nr:hypothetical protein N7492_001461 [Penicillium capsulatum]KAJ6129485.1 hypothetical protein N7512_002265 [Penicillium capsulatum]
MRSFKFIPFLFSLAIAIRPENAPTCNEGDGLEKGDVSLSKLCSNAQLNGDGWLYVDCDVGAKPMRFGVGLNYCVTDDGGEISIREDGMAMNTPSCRDTCKAIVNKGDYAKLKCSASDCQGEIDLDKAVTFNGSYLKCGKHIGSGGSQIKKRAMRDDDL